MNQKKETVNGAELGTNNEHEKEVSQVKNQHHSVLTCLMHFYLTIIYPKEVCDVLPRELHLKREHGEGSSIDRLKQLTYGIE